MLATDLCDMIACCHMWNVSDVSRSTISMTVNKGAMITTLNSSGERLHTSGSSGEQGDSLREKGSIRLTTGTMGSKGSDFSVESSASSAADGTPASRKAGVWTDVFLCLGSPYHYAMSSCSDTFVWCILGRCLCHAGGIHQKCWNLLKILRRLHNRIPSKLFKPFNSFEYDYSEVS